MKQIICLTSIILNAFIVGAQIGFERNIIKDGVFLVKTGTELQCAIDESKAVKYASLSKNPLYASVKKDHVNILMEYINPLTMSYDISFSSEINPDVKNLVEFINGLSPILSKVGLLDKEVSKINTNDMFENLAGSKKSDAVSEIKYTNVDLHNKELKQVVQLIVTNQDCYFIKTKETDKKIRHEKNTILINKFKNNLELLREAEVDFKPYTSKIRQAISILLDANTIEKAREAYAQFNKAMLSVDSIKNAQKGKLNKLNKFFEGNEELATIGQNEGTKLDSLRAGYTKVTREFYINSYKDKVDKQFELYDELVLKSKELAERFKKALDYYIGCEKCQSGMKLTEIPISKEDIKTVSIIVKTYTIKLTEDMQLIVTENDKVNGTIVLKYYSKISIDLGTGPLYISGFTYNKYSTEFNPTTGGFNVVKLNPEKMNAALGTMLNIIWKTDTYPIFPMVQVGFAIGKDAPVVFAGLGLKTIKNISISAGILSGWYKELNTLGVGDVVKGEAQLEADYRYRSVKNAAFYVGIQYSF